MGFFLVITIAVYMEVMKLYTYYMHVRVNEPSRTTTWLLQTILTNPLSNMVPTKKRAFVETALFIL